MFCSQIFPTVGERDLFDFFKVIGKVNDINLIRDARSGKSKGMAYIEFEDRESVVKAIALNGQKIGGFPIVLQTVQPPVITTKKTPSSATANTSQFASSQPSVAVNAISQLWRVHLGNIAQPVTESDLKLLFSPFSSLMKVEIIRDSNSGNSRGYGFVSFVPYVSPFRC